MDEKKTQIDRVYAEMIYSLLTEMNGALMSQVRSINNTLSVLQRTVLNMNDSVTNLDNNLKETRDRRQLEEISNLETSLESLRKQLEEKKNARESSGDTSEKIRAVSLDTIKNYQEAEKKAKSIDWIDVRNKVLTYTWARWRLRSFTR